MQRFAWRLQRLLDIKVKQEDAVRSEVVAVTEQAVAVRGRIMLERSALRRLLTDLTRTHDVDRLAAQQIFVRFSQVTEDRIRTLEKSLAELELLRRRKMDELMKIRRFRKSLEKLREKALERFQIEQRRQEQKYLDDRVSMGIARRIVCAAGSE